MGSSATVDAICNLSSVTKIQAAIVELTKAMRDTTGNLPPQRSIFPDFTAPVVHTGLDGLRARENALGHAVVAEGAVRWGQGRAPSQTKPLAMRAIVISQLPQEDFLCQCSI